MLSGVKTKPRPKPCSTPETMIGPIPICSEKPVICHIAIDGQQQPGQDDQPGVDAADQPGDEEHRRHRADAARRRHQPGRHHRIVHQILQHRRQQRHRAEQRDADQEHQHGADDAVGVLQQLAVEERAVGRGRGVDDEQIEAERRRSSPRSRSRSSRTSPSARRGRAASARRRSPGSASRSRRNRTARDGRAGSRG